MNKHGENEWFISFRIKDDDRQNVIHAYKGECALDAWCHLKDQYEKHTDVKKEDFILLNMAKL